MTTTTPTYSITQLRRRPSLMAAIVMFVLPCIILPIIAAASPLLATHQVKQFQVTGTIQSVDWYPSTLNLASDVVSTRYGHFDVNVVGGGATTAQLTFWARADYQSHPDIYGDYAGSETRYQPETTTGLVVLLALLCFTGLVLVITGAARAYRATHYHPYPV